LRVAERGGGSGPGGGTIRPGRLFQHMVTGFGRVGKKYEKSWSWDGRGGAIQTKGWEKWEMDGSCRTKRQSPKSWGPGLVQPGKEYGIFCGGGRWGSVKL